MCLQHNHSVSEAFSPGETFLPDKNSFAAVDPVFKCPLIGMCLSRVEQCQLVRKSIQDPKKLSPFEMHEYLVSAAEINPVLARGIQRKLTQKYEREAVLLRKLDDASFRTQWKKAFASGQYKAFIWAVATHETLSSEVKRLVYGDIHMAMHGAAEEQLLAASRITELLRKQVQQARRLKQASEYKSEVQKSLLALQGRCQSLQQALATVRNERDEIQQKFVVLQSSRGQDIQERCTCLENKNSELVQEIANLHAQNTAQGELVNALLQQQRLSAQSRRKSLEKTSHGALLSASENLSDFPSGGFDRQKGQNGKSCCMESECSDACPAWDGCWKRILIVGGIERMESRYRLFIEENGGTLEYHDGSMRGGKRKLEQSLLRADIVLCPVDHNSHGACLAVKSLAKKHNKPFRMLPNGSLATLSGVLSPLSRIDTSSTL